MPSAGKRALALLLCLTALVSLTGCGLQITIDIAPTATPTVLPTSTPAGNEETSGATAIASAVSTATSPVDTNIIVTPAATASTTPTAAASATQPPTASPPPAPTTSPKHPSREEALEILGGPRLNEDEEIASLCAEWGVQDERRNPAVAFEMTQDGSGCWSAEIELKHGYFYARYDENLRRTSSFYIRDSELQGQKVNWVQALQGENWCLVMHDVPREKVPREWPKIAGFEDEKFGDTVDLICLLSDWGEILGGYIVPLGSRILLFEDDAVLYDEKDESFIVDLRTNTIRSALKDQTRRFADGSYVDSSWSLDEKETPQEIQFCRADGTVYRTMQPEEFYDRIDEELAARSRDGYTFSLITKHYIQFVSPAECHILFYPYVEYNGEYISTSYELCLLAFEV